MMSLGEAANASERISRVIFNYAARIGQEQDIDALLQLNADMARDLVAAERCSIWLVDHAAGQIHTRVAHGVEQIRVSLGHGLVGVCIAQGEPLVINDAASDSRFLGHVDKTTGFVTQSVLVIPLRSADGAVIGALQALNKKGGFTESDITLLGLAGSYSAAAIETQRLRGEAETARMFMRELEIARDVQARLLPQHPPHLERVERAMFFRPAKLVGGDYYDLIRAPDGGLAFTLGDVSGKGIPAAVFMASMQASLRIPFVQGRQLLTDLIADVNDSAHTSASAGRYSTLFCGLIDSEARTLTYVNAGHCPPMLVRRAQDGKVTVRLLTAGGFPLGLFPGAQYEQEVVGLEPGDLVVCYSDGISEATSAENELWGESQIEKLLEESVGRSPDEVTKRLVEAADNFAAGAEQADDMTILTLRIL